MVDHNYRNYLCRNDSNIIYPHPKIYDQDIHMHKMFIIFIDIFIRIQKTFTNVHKHIGIRKYLKHLTTLFFGSGTKLFITFLSLRFFNIRRERHNVLLCWLFIHRQLLTHWPNKYAAHFVDPNWSCLSETKNQQPSSRLESQLTAFFQIPKYSAHRFQAWRHSPPRSHCLSWVFIVTSVIVTSAPHTCEHLHSICAPD